MRNATTVQKKKVRQIMYELVQSKQWGLIQECAQKSVEEARNRPKYT